jgi:hypothetical protein
MIHALAPEVAVGDTAKLVVDQRKEGIEPVLAAGTCAQKKLGDVP